MLRAVPTCWFELVTTHHDFARAMRFLAGSGAVQLEAIPLAEKLPAMPYLEGFFDEFSDMEKRYRVFWPTANPNLESSLENPVAILEETLTKFRDWSREADPMIRRRQTLETRRIDLKLHATLIESLGPRYPIEQLSAGSAKILSRAIYFLPEDKDELVIPAGQIVCDRFPADGGAFLIAVGPEEEMAEFHSAMNARKARTVSLFETQTAEKTNPGQLLRQQLGENERALDAVMEQFNGLAEKYALGEALASVDILRWLYKNSNDIQAGQRTIRITGWTKARTGERLRKLLAAGGVNFVLSISRPGKGGDAPMVFSNPAWAKPFEYFPRMLGVPGNGEADPSILAAIIAPVIFGFMFGDVGQGAVLLIAGLVMYKRFPLLALLIPGGLAAMVFGFLFGSVFAREDIITPLVVHPMHAPVGLLAIALIIGAALLLLGLALDALQSAWQGKLSNWLVANGGICLAYCALLASWWQPLLAWGVGVGMLWSFAGVAAGDRQWSFQAGAAGLAEFVENLMRLLVNTMSFARVGAFALAHAGLSAAIVGVGEAAGTAGYWPILILGNVLILCLEGLVAGIQTTRLILFEFFIRFYTAGGREFRPLSPPQTISG